MTLTAAQERARAGKMTGSQINIVMSGNAEKILQLYLERIGEREPEDLSRVWPVQRGVVMEPLIRRWYEMENNCTLVRVGEVVTSAAYPWAAATLDGFIAELPGPFEAKAVGGREPIEIVIDRYQPQCQWQMLVTQTQQCALSVAMADRPPVVTFLEAVTDYQQTMLERGEYFMQCVALKRPPVALEAVPPPLEPTAIINMTGNNLWADNADAWLQTRLIAEQCEDCKQALKILVPGEAKICFGHGVKITRDRAGRLHLRAEDQ